jgi:multicomponent Na+:H+ antiporter subunit C
MNIILLYALTGCAIFTLGLYALFTRRHLLRKVLAANVAGSGLFLVFIAIAYGTPGSIPDPVPHAMVLTGIVVAVSATALALVLAVRFRAVTGRTSFGEEEEEKEKGGES